MVHYQFRTEITTAIRPESFYFLVLGKFQVKYMVGEGNKNRNKREEKAEAIKIMTFFIRNTCKICIICLNKMYVIKKNRIQKANFSF